jgi:hypothetical protein
MSNMVSWFVQRLCAFGALGILINLLALDFQPQKGAKDAQVWELGKQAVLAEADSSARSRELFFASAQLSESELRSAGSMSDQTERNLVINLGDEVYTILGLFVGATNKTVTLSDVEGEIIELGINDRLPDGRKIRDINLNSLTLRKEDGSVEFIEIYER